MPRSQASKRSLIEGRPALIVIDIQAGTFVEKEVRAIEHMPGYARRLAKARAAIGTWIDELGSGGAKMEPLICYGHRAREILRQADELGCDLIVLSSHRIDPDHPAGGIGTISHQVALVCDGPVLLIR